MKRKYHQGGMPRRTTSGRYAFYWNAFLLNVNLQKRLHSKHLVYFHRWVTMRTSAITLSQYVVCDLSISPHKPSFYQHAVSNLFTALLLGKLTFKLGILINYRQQRSWAKVIFSQACFKNSVHREQRPPWEQIPPDQADTPPPDQADTPQQTRQTPPDQAAPPGKQTPVYGLRAAGTHPTGMHSCFN